tara:strand:+ start:491 stop:1321 length:831 start_codon:yes stop_codon:yes gene_type:complete
MPNPFNEVEISDEEVSSLSSEEEMPVTQDANNSDSNVENSSEEVAGEDTEDEYQMWDTVEERFVDPEEVQQWKDSHSNKSEWQKSNTEKAQGISKWSKLMDKVSTDESFRNHLTEYFGDDKNAINSLGLNGIEALKEEFEAGEGPIESQESNRSLEDRVNDIELDKQTDVLEMKFDNFVSANNEVFTDVKSEIDFLEFMENKGMKDFEDAFRLWNYDNVQTQLKHSKELELNKQRNAGKVVQTKAIGASKDITPPRIASNYKNVNLSDPEIAKYFE